MEANQCRAGRALLDMTQAELAKAASVSLTAVNDFEIGKRRTQAATRDRIKAALEAAGVVFIDAPALGGTGVLLSTGGKD